MSQPRVKAGSQPGLYNRSMDVENNVTDTALIFEGGGMRAAYTAAVVTTLLNEGIFFDYVAGISAGSSHTANYVSRDPVRAHHSFVDFVGDPNFGSWKTWFEGKGRFNAEYIYEQSYFPDGPLPFDYEMFMANPARVRIGAYDVSAGQTIYWSKRAMADAVDLMTRVRASSSLPFSMPPTVIDDKQYVDGALGSGGGIPLSVAKKDGFDKFFVVLSREKSYVKPSYAPYSPLLKAYFRKHPTIAEGILRRPGEYNSTRQQLLELEKQGKAYLFFPEIMPVTNKTTDVAQLQRAYNIGLDQAIREVPRWREFLNLPSEI